MILHSKENMTSDFDLWHMVNSDCKDYIAESRSDTTSYSLPGMPTPPLSPELQHSSSSASFYLNSSSLLSTYEASSTARTNEHSGVESYHIRRSFDHVCHNNPLDRLNGADLLANDVENNTVDHLSPPLQGGVGFEDFTDIDIMDNLSAIAQHMDYSVNEVEPTKYIVHDIMWSGTAKIASDIHNQCQTKNTSKCCLCESGCDDSSSDSDNFEAVSPRKIDPTVPPPKVKENSGSDECIASKVDSAPNRVNGFETPSDSDDDVVDIETIDENSLTRNTEKHQTIISALPTYQRYQMTKRRQRRQSEESGEVSPTIVTSTMTHVASMHNYSTTQPMVPTATHTNTTSARLASILARGHRSVELSGSESKKTKHRYAPYNKNNRRQGMESDDSLSEGSKRAQHNVLERKRRNDLKSSFDRLRQSVPELQNVDRAAKVLILKKAAEFIYSLRNVENAQSETMSRLKARRAALLSRKEALSSVQFSI